MIGGGLPNHITRMGQLRLVAEFYRYILITTLTVKIYVVFSFSFHVIRPSRVCNNNQLTDYIREMSLGMTVKFRHYNLDYD